ncbi:hypothetical protein MKW92_026304 [Papaver armeniacum]|nr:hypothetical protein MKW92_026304 [Papaver armeniacum]
MDKRPCSSQESEVRKGPWTMEEDMILINYIANHGEGVWNSLARSAGLNRTGKSCRLRWLNYLRPDVRRGNITPEEQLLIMELHAKWGNRWSKIARHLPGRTDNEIKNFWRTKIQKHMKQPGDNSSQNPGQTSTDLQHCGGASTSTQTSTTEDGVENYSPIYTADHHLHQHLHHNHPSFPPNTLPPPETNNENFWSMEDLWSMQLLNGD